MCWTRLPGDANIAKELNECVEKSQTKRSEKDFKAIAVQGRVQI